MIMIESDIKTNLSETGNNKALPFYIYPNQ